MSSSTIVLGGRSPVAEGLYQEFAYQSPKISYQLVDPTKHPELAERYKVTVMNTTHIQYGSDETGSGTNVSDMSEQAITNAIVKVTKTEHKTVCFLAGEGEDDPDDASGAIGMGQFKDSLLGESYKVNKVNLVTEDKVPEDCSVMVVAGPTRPLVQHVIDALTDYLKGGGRAFIMFKPQSDQTVDEAALVKFAQDWGVKAGNNVVVDQVVRLYAGPALGLNPLVTTYTPHAITASFNKQTVFPMVRTVDPVDSAAQGLSVTPLAKTSETSWAETDLDGIFKRQSAKFGGNDVKGPVTVAVAVAANLDVLKFGQGEARLGAFADKSVLMAAGADDGGVGALRQRGEVGRRMRLRQLGPRLFGKILRQRHQVVALERLGDLRHELVLARARLEVAELKEQVAEILPPDHRHRRRLPGRRHAVFAMAARAILRLLFDGLGVRGDRNNRKREGKRYRQSSHSIC